MVWPSPPPAPATPCNPQTGVGCGLWTVTSGANFCTPSRDSPDGSCITDGRGDYGNNERCVITANVDLYASATYYSVEVRWRVGSRAPCVSLDARRVA